MTAIESPAPLPPFASVDDAETKLAAAGYIADRNTAVVAWLAGVLGRPLLIEGPAGVGKTELAKAVARAAFRELVRLQCYEGLDEARALYEWDYGKQMLVTQLVREESEAKSTDLRVAVDRAAASSGAFFQEAFLVPRPLLRAITSPTPVVLLVDEVDRSDPEFEALLLEVLSDFQVTIPELGVRRARTLPYVVLTSNATRPMTEALRRRCLYLELTYPDAARERALVKLHVPEAEDALIASVVAVAQAIRTVDLRKTPSVSEVLDWTRALVLLHAHKLDAALVAETLSTLAKHAEDVGPMKAAAAKALAGR